MRIPVIDQERSKQETPFHQVTGEVLQTGVASHERTRTDCVLSFVENEQVDRQHRQNENKRKGETLAPGLFAARAKVSPVPRESDRTVHASAQS